MTPRAKFMVPILTLKDNGGGAVAMALARALAAAGGEVVVVSSAFHGTRAIDRPENAGIRFVLAPAVGGSRIASVLAFFAVACFVSLREAPRIVYTHIATALIPGRGSSRSLWLAQDLEYRFFSERLRPWMKRLFHRTLKSNQLLVTSDWLATCMRRMGADIRYASDVGITRRWVERPSRDQARDIDFLLIAKRGAHKRQAETRAVAAQLAARGYRVTLVDQERASWPEGWGQGQGVPEVREAVPVETMAELFGRARVFVSLSLAEGYGLPPVEALASGAHVLATPTPSVAHLVHEHLVVLRGREEIVERAIDAALALHGQATARGAVPIAYPGPFMEQWSRAAADAVLAA